MRPGSSFVVLTVAFSLSAFGLTAWAGPDSPAAEGDKKCDEKKKDEKKSHEGHEGGCAGAGCSTPAEGPKDQAPGPKLDLPGTSYGAGVTVKDAIPISKLISDGAKYDGKRVRVEGMITDVCAKRGCWMRMASDKEFQTLLFKVQDGVMVFPMAAKGKYAVAEGTVKRIQMTLEATRKMLAEEAAQRGEKFDESKVTEPGFMVRLDGIGAVVRDKK